MIASALALTGAALALYELVRLRLAVDRAHTEARTDGLTGLGNRRSWDEKTGELRRRDEGFAFVLFDVANLKAANTALGHVGADEILQRIASHVRDGELVGDRIGGDEFAILMPRRSIAEAGAARDRIEAAVGCIEIAPGAAVFLAGAPGRWLPGQDLRVALRAADAALEARKAARKRALDLPGTREATLALVSRD